MATSLVPSCHPDRPYVARGLCRQCYGAYWHARGPRPKAPPRMAECHPDRIHHASGMCVGCYNAKYQAANREGARQRSAEFRLAVPWASRKGDSNHRRYGVSAVRFEEMHESQGGLCLICHSPELSKPVLCIDHDHATGKIRGLLCIRCNAGLGQFRDNPAIMRAAAIYIEVCS